MKKKQTVLNVPLLYIVQPKLEPTVSHMQMSYTGRMGKEKVKSEITSGANTEKERRTVREEFKQFQEMTVDEQLRFLVKLPNRLSKLKCKLITKHGEYEGFLREYDGDTVLFTHSVTNKQANISVQQIDSIVLIGLHDS